MKYKVTHDMIKGNAFILEVTRLSEDKSAFRYPIYLDYEYHPITKYGWNRPSHPKLYEIINRNRDIYASYLEKFNKYKENFCAIGKYVDPENPTKPAWINGWLPGLDSISIYGFISENKPNAYYEVGSGNSTKFARQAIIDNKLDTTIVSIDPYPRAEIDAISDINIREPLELTDLYILDGLQAGDVVFIDNSHRSFMNSDVTVSFIDVLPNLKSGVFVGFHDIFLPNDYPKEWDYRYYNEQYLLAAYLLAEGNKFEIIFPGTFITTDEALSSILSPIWNDPRMESVETGATSFWLKVK